MPADAEPVDSRALPEGAQPGDCLAMDLMQHYLPRLRAFVRARLPGELRRRVSDSDVVQSVCRELIAHRDTFSYRGESQFRGWLFTSALNKVREKVRFHRQGKRDLRREHDVDEVLERVGNFAEPLPEVLAAERVSLLEQALARLPEPDREVISLARLAGLPIAEVAGRLGKNVEAAKKQLGRALLRLGALLNASEAAT